MRNIIPYGRQWIDKQDIQEVINVLKSDWITQGPKIKEFEEALCKYTGVKYAVAVSSGTAALHIACLAAGITQGDEVITSPITFVASANCVLYCGGKPVFADIQEDTVNIDPIKIEEYLRRQRAVLRQSLSRTEPKGWGQVGRGQKVKAIIPVHFAGHPCDMDKIYSIARKYNLIVIEDASHALGAEYKIKQKWVKVGSCLHSDMVIFSFHPVKSITTGEGGAVLTNRKDLYKKLLMFRNHGITKDNSQLTGPWYYEMQELGFNYRITDFQCALGLSQLKKLDNFINKRRKIVDLYNREFKDISKMEIPVEKKNVKSSWHIYPVQLKNSSLRKEIFEYFRRRGIGVQVHYIPVHLQPYYRKRFNYKPGDYPKAENFYRKVITLPVFSSIEKDQLKEVIKLTKEIITKKMDAMAVKPICIIPAKGRSSRLVQKNMKELCGKPLFVYAIEAALESRIFDRVYVSTEDKKIAEIAGKYKRVIPFIRPDELSRPKASVVDVCLHLLQYLEEKDDRPEVLCVLLPTSPLRTAEDIIGAFNKFKKNKAKFLMAITKFIYDPFESLKKDKNNYLKPYWGIESTRIKRQDRPKLFVDNGAIYIVNIPAFEKEKSFYGSKLIGYNMPPERSIDINTYFEFEIAEYSIEE